MDNFSDLLDELSCGEDERAEAALSHLAAWGPEALTPLQERLSSPEPEVRWWAVRALAEMTDERVPALLVKALSDTNKDVRWCAGLALREHPAAYRRRAALDRRATCRSAALAVTVSCSVMWPVRSPVLRRF